MPAKRPTPREPKIRPAAPAGGGYVVGSLGAVATFFGVSRDTVRKDWQAREMPGAKGRYDLAAIARWRIARAEADAFDGEGAGDLKGRLAEADVRKAEADAATKELNLRERRGELVSRAAVSAELAQVLASVRGRLEQMPRELAGAIPPEHRDSVAEDLRHRIALAQRELAGLNGSDEA